ncbi:sugar ABC transporter substrate-binding protein [Sphaerimonospora cavernae]|uniref:Sugar ABC transporter substrate-binding protein n=1 Tax=Sphaerimonospora cavernae TaxID=1740611 RepID=A0ABV6TYP2_9ACTN
MKIAKIAAVTTTTAALALALAACSSSDDSSDSSSSSSAAPSAAENGKKFEGQTLKVWRMGSPDSNPAAVKYMEDLNAKFKEQTGADVDLQWIPWPDAQNKWSTAVASGEGPDVTEMGNDQVPGWVEQDALAEITDAVKGDADLQQIPENLLGYESREGKIYAVPWGGGSRAVLYRTDWFKDLGLEIPKTWDELVATAKTIVAKKGKDVDGFAFNGGSDANAVLSPFIWSAGGDYATLEGGKWVGKLTEPGTKEGFQFYTDLVAKEGVSGKSRLTQNSTDIRTRFANNKVGMYVTAGWDIDSIKKESNGKVDEKKMAFFPIPTKDGNGAAPTMMGGNDLAVWGTTKNKELAAEYLKLATGKEWGVRFAKENGLIPVYPEAADAYAQENPEQQAFVDAYKVAHAYPATPNWGDVNEVKSVLQNAARAVIEGKKSVDDALADANTEVESILNQ